jgi:hypothetical protein
MTWTHRHRVRPCCGSTSAGTIRWARANPKFGELNLLLGRDVAALGDDLFTDRRGPEHLAVVIEKRHRTPSEWTAMVGSVSPRSMRTSTPAAASSARA